MHIRERERERERGRERIYMYTHMRSRRTAEDRQYRMDRWTNGQTVQPRTLLSFSSCYMCIDILIARERERESDRHRIPLRQHSTHCHSTNSFSPFSLTPYSAAASRRFCSSSTMELRVLLFFLHYHSRHHQHQVLLHTYI
jgi:hypothetical protein